MQPPRFWGFTLFSSEHASKEPVGLRDKKGAGDKGKGEGRGGAKGGKGGGKALLKEWQELSFEMQSRWRSGAWDGLEVSFYEVRIRQDLGLFLPFSFEGKWEGGYSAKLSV